MLRAYGLIFGVGSVLRCGAAVAAADPMAIYYDNTLESHRPGADPAIHHQIYFNRDGTFDILDNGERTTAGTYVYHAEGDRICLTPTVRGGKPIGPGAAPLPCRAAFTTVKVGDVWQDREGGNGAAEEQHLIAGRQYPTPSPTH